MQIMKWLTPAALLVLVLSVPQPVDAAPSTGESTTNVEDLYYDFEVWVAWDVVKYVVVAKFQDGHTEEFKFNTYQDADDWIAWLYFHIAEFTGATIEQHWEQSPWVYVETFDKRADAESLAAAAVNLGFYADVIRVSALMRNTAISR